MRRSESVREEAVTYTMNWEFCSSSSVIFTCSLIKVFTPGVSTRINPDFNSSIGAAYLSAAMGFPLQVC